MKWERLTLLLFFIIPSAINGQEKFTLSGKVTDRQSGEDLIGANIIIAETGTGVATNSYGFYSISLPGGRYSATVSFIGYQNKTDTFILNNNLTINYELDQQMLDMEEVVVRATASDRNISSASSGTERLNIKTFNHLPVLFGERDILKTIQLLPGISGSSEGSTGFNVRGGSIGHNLILLDEAPVYSPSHLMGFFSVFNSDAINDATIYRGSIPAMYGGRASSVLDISMNNGNSKNAELSGGIGLVSSRLTFEGPLMRDKISLILSGRRTYADLAGKLLLPDNIIPDDMQFYFYDLNAKINYTVNKRNRIFLSTYFGEDVFELGDNIGTAWGNNTATVRWNHLFSERLFSNTSLIYSRFNYGFYVGRYSMRLRSGIRDISLKEDLSAYIKPGSTLRFGTHISYHTFRPGELKSGDNTGFEIVLGEKKAIEGALYLMHEKEQSKRLSVQYGFRVSAFSQYGPAWFYKYNDLNAVIDSTWYQDGRAAYPWFCIEPRASTRITAGTGSSFKLSYSRMSQYMHLLSNSTAGSPTDVWIPVSNNIKPLRVHHFSGGFFKNFTGNGIETSFEIYYKDIENTSDYEDGAELILNRHVEAEILAGKGRSYGLELFVKKKYGKLSGWFAYTLSRTENRIKGINNNQWYPVKHDRTHDISLIAVYKAGQRLKLSGTWVFATGNAVTYPSGMYTIMNRTVPYYSERNAYRMPAYHRLDISLSLETKKSRKFHSEWEISVYNLYNRKNAYTITFRESETIAGTNEAVKLSLFGIIPSVSYKFNF